MKFLEFIKKQSVGFYLTIVTVIAAIVATCLFFTVDPTLKSFIKGMYVPSFITLTIFGLALLIASLVCAELFGSTVKISEKLVSLITYGLSIASVALLAGGLIALINAGVYETAMALGSALGDHAKANLFLAVVIIYFVSLLLTMATTFFKAKRSA